MNQAAQETITRAARRAVAADKAGWRQNYRRTMVNPITMKEHIGQFAGDVTGAWTIFTHNNPDVAGIAGAGELFATVYQRGI